jgi:hypothetical protein
MAFESNLSCVSMKAAGDLSAKQYYFVKVTAANSVNVAGDGELAHGVLQDKPASGEMGSVAISGITMIKCGGTISAGGLVSSDASGTAVANSGTDYILGVAIEGGASGEIIPVLLLSAGKLAHS